MDGVISSWHLPCTIMLCKHLGLLSLNEIMSVVEFGLVSLVSSGIYICVVYFLNHNCAFGYWNQGMWPFSCRDFQYLGPG